MTSMTGKKYLQHHLLYTRILRPGNCEELRSGRDISYCIMPSVFSSPLQLAFQIYLLSIHTASAFQCRVSQVGYRGLSRLNAVTPIISSKIGPTKDLFLPLRLEFGRAVEMLVNAPLHRKIVVLAHPVAILLLYLLFTSKLLKNCGEIASRSFASIASSVSSSIKKFQKESVLAISLAKAKIQDQNSQTTGTVESVPPVTAVSAVVPAGKFSIVGSADTNLIANTVAATTTLPTPVKKEIISPSAAIIAKIADIEAQEKAYMKAQKLKRETAMKASLAKAQAFEAEQLRVERIAKASREADEFRVKHDIEFRRWDKEQNGSEAENILRLEKEVEKATQDILNEKLAAEALKISNEKLAADERQKNLLMSIVVEDVNSRAAMEQEMDRLAVKAAVDKAVKDAEAAYALQIKEKAALLKVGMRLFFL